MTTRLCGCVRVNGEIDIVTMVDQEKRGRIGIEPGLVEKTRSARKDCPECKGTGLLEERSQ